MPKLPEELNPQIEHLLLNKAFDDLTTEEINLVHKYLSKAEYEAFRSLLLNAKDVFQEEQLQPKAEVKANLLKALKAKKNNSNSIIDTLNSLLLYPIPAWKVGLASVVFLMGFYFYTLNNDWQLDKHWTNVNTVVNDSLAINQSRSVQADKELLNLLRGVR